MPKTKIENLNIFEDVNPIGDILFICLGAFVLLFFTAVFEVSSTQEMTLPDVNLTRLSKQSVSNSSSDISLTITPGKTGGIEISLGNKSVTLQTLEEILTGYGGMAKIALRVDESLTVEIRNKVIAACSRAGVKRVADVIEIKY